MVCLACITSAAGMVTTKLITKRVEQTVILFYLGLASSVCGTVGLFSVGRPSVPALWEWAVAVSVGVLGLIQQYCLVFAVHLESPSRVSVVRQLQIVIAYVVQVERDTFSKKIVICRLFFLPSASP
jgi:drug/metabolite transporter (DMT)-like permease